MTHEELLASSEFFADAPSSVIAAIAANAQELPLIRGDVLFKQGDSADSMFLVISGRIAILIDSPYDHRETVVALMEDGEMFGEMAMLDGEMRSTMARALEPSTVLAVPYEPVLDAYRDDPSLLWGVVRVLARRLRRTDADLADGVFLDVTGRTAKRLLEFSEGRNEFVLPITQEELAGRVGASRERVNKAIGSFIRLGWLEQRERSYTILNRKALSDRST